VEKVTQVAHLFIHFYCNFYLLYYLEINVEKKQNNKNIGAWIEYSRRIIQRYLLNKVKVKTPMNEKIPI
jgi:hypothetical protein